MGEVPRIVDQLTRAYEGDAWHGPSLTKVLSDVDAAAAAARPIPGGHTIWEVLLHIATWEDVTRRRLEGERIGSVPNDVDWPPVGETTDAAWAAARRRLDECHRRLRAAMAKVDDSRLGDPVAEKDYTVYILLHGIVQHDLYHAGQIALLKKARAG
jgi:uncharacterized damage-inducible protein DinB